MDAPLFDVTSTSNWWAIFAALFVAALALRFAPSANKSAKDDKPIDATAAIGAVPGAASLKARYLAVFLALKFADWMQGPYFFSVYAFIYAQQHVGGNDGDSSDQAAVRKLVAVTQVVGFVSGAVFGSFAGAVADKMGRKKAAAFGALCAAVSCSTAAAGHTLPIAAVVAGRVAGGVASSLQYSALEAWLTSEVKSLDFKGSGDDAGAWTSRVFALQGFSDGISAVIAGVVAEQLNSMYGPQGPYAAAAVLAGLVCIAALTLWSENYGGHAKEAGKKDEGGSAMGNMGSALSLIFTDKIIGLQGLAQSLFEGSMFCFVMIWVPSLSAAVTASGTTGDVPLGLIFSCFMACIMIGSALFGFLADRGLATETILKGTIIAAAACLAAPAAVEGRPAMTAIAYLCFEACCGLSFPGFGTMRARVIPDEVKSTVIALYRVPLNLFVVAVLLNVDRLGDTVALRLCAGALAVSLVLQSVVATALAAKEKAK